MKRWKRGIVILALALPVALLAAEVVRLTITLRHRDARSLLARVTEELGPKGRISVDGERNRITVEDEGSIVQRVARLIAQLDQPARRFAVGTKLEIFPAPPSGGPFKQDPGFVDMTHWMEKSRPSQVLSAMVTLDEGGGASAGLGPEYGLTLAAGGYDPTQRRLTLKTLNLWRASGGRKRTVISGGAALPEGQTTSLVVGAASDQPPLKLHLTPALLPTVDSREVPR